MTKSDDTKAGGEAAPATQDVVEKATSDPMTSGIRSLREAGSEPLRLWTVKAPKEIGGLDAARTAPSRVIFMGGLLPAGGGGRARKK